MRLNKTKKWLFGSCAFFVILILLIVPFIHSFFLSNIDLKSKLILVLASQKIEFAAAILGLALVLMVSRSDLVLRQYKREWLYLVAAILLFSLSFSTMSNLDSILRQGVSINSVSQDGHTFIDIDSQRLFSMDEFDTIDKGAYFIPLDNLTARRVLTLDDVSMDRDISFIVYSGNFTQANFSLSVNNFTFNITGLQHDANIKNLKFRVDKSLLSKINIVEINGKGVSILVESLYPEGNSFFYQDGLNSSDSNLTPVNGEALIYFRGQDTSNIIFYTLYKFNFLFILGAIVYLFVFSFGTEFAKKCMARYKTEFLASLIFALIFSLALSLLR